MYKILIIEDDLNLALSIRESLKTFSFHTIVVNDGAKGSRLSMKDKYDAIILDYGLPNTNGDDIVRRVRTNGIETPILMITGRQSIHDLEQSYRMGVDDYIRKPFSINELLSRLTHLVEKPPIRKETIITTQYFSIDLGTKSIEKDGITISLTKRELRLLEFLVLHKGCVISRDRLISNVWMDKPLLTSNTIDSYVSNLRKKLKTLEIESFIDTVHGYGYILKI